MKSIIIPVGAILTINCFRFKIINADAAVYYYMQEHPEMFPTKAIEAVRQVAHVWEESICNSRSTVKRRMAHTAQSTHKNLTRISRDSIFHRCPVWQNASMIAMTIKPWL